jgi:tetratricopeptide (TPR) repeat protein
MRVIAKHGTFEYGLADRYRFEEELGSGAMGVVFRAHDLRLGREVAIKMLHPTLTSEVGVARFQYEINVAAKLRHPNIIAVHDSGEVDGRLYYAMDYLGGETLRALLRREKQLSGDEALRIVEDIAEALQYAHDRHVVHRDVKPENILLADGRACLLDFGLARALGEVDANRLTASGLAVGTPHYLSPEQASAEREVGPKADQYALACVLYEMLVGEPPFTGPTASAIAMRHISESPPPMRSRRKSTSPGIEAAVMRALEKVPADRFHSVQEFADAARVTPLVTNPLPDTIGKTASVEPPRRACWRSRPRFVAEAVAVGMLAVAAILIIPRVTRGRLPTAQSIVIFPLHVSKTASSGAADDIGESASLLIAYRLEGTPGLQFSNAADHLTGSERTGERDLTLDRKRQIAHSVGADRLIDGWVQSHGDSLTVVLRLQATDGSTQAIQQGVTALASTAEAPRLALGALRMLLPAFLDPGRRVDQSALEQREPAAIAAFLEGERAYRDSHFAEALGKYATAIERDSLLAVAALKAAQAASWLGQMSDASEYAGLAVRHVDLLPPRYAVYANALQHYLRGEGDSTIAAVSTLVAVDRRWTDAWFLLGEAYFHLMPQASAPRSQGALADSAFRMAGRADNAFSPATAHLLDLAFRRGDIARVDSLFPLVRRTLDENDTRWLEAIVRCVRDGPASVNWDVLRSAGSLGGWNWGETLMFDPGRATCARAAFAVTLATPNAPPSELWGALVGTNALLIAAGRDKDAEHLLKTPLASRLRGWALFFPNAAAGASFASDAKQKADSLEAHFSALASPHLWLLTSWYSTNGDSVALGRIAAVMAVRRDSTHSHLDSLVAGVASAHFAAARRDTTAALRSLASLAPVAPYGALAGQPWEAMAGERMLEASLLAAQGKDAEAIRVANRLDVQVPMINLVFLRPSLLLRERSSRRLGDTGAAADYRRQLARWSSQAR